MTGTIKNPETTHAIRVHGTGGPEVMRWEEVALPAPQPDEARVRQHAVGLNYLDIYHRSGLYPLPLPTGLGVAAAGVVEAVGGQVPADIRPGDRVVYAGGAVGAYAEARNVPAKLLIRLPEAIDFATAAAATLRGLTAQYLLRRTYRVQAGDAILFHAAAGGVGSIACQWAKALGATVIGTVGSEAKAEFARQHGCDQVIVYTQEDFASRVREITGGKGVAVVYDSIGRDTFAGSLDCLRALGLMVCFGSASGPLPPIDTSVLTAKGSLYLTRPTINHYVARREDLLASAAEFFDMVASRRISIEVKQRYPLQEAARAHAELASRQTTGSSVLLPSVPSP